MQVTRLFTAPAKPLAVALAVASLLCFAPTAFCQDRQDKSALQGGADGANLSPRQKEILRGIAQYAPWDCPDRWLYELGSLPERGPVVRGRMLTAVSWMHFLAYATLLDWSDEEAAATLKDVTRRLPEIKSGKVRQNVIFLIALAAPDAKDKLKAVFESKDGKLSEEDRIDAGCALAMLGDSKAGQWFEKEFKGSTCMTGRPVFDFSDYVKEEEKDSREVTRSYRTWEVLFRRPYFRSLQFLCRSSIYTMNKHGMSQSERDVLTARFLPLFPAKWPGHPGCDDFAVRMLHFAIAAKDLKSAYRWAQRATLLPDQDCREPMERIFTSVAESQLSSTDIDEILASPEGKHNRDFLQYTRFLALAREDTGRAIELFDRLALSDRHGFFAHARLLAAESPVPEGMRGGVDNELALRILVDYPKRSTELGKTAWEPAKEVSEEDYLGVLTYREREVMLRTRLARQDSVELDAGKVARQYRFLLELHNLEQMEKSESDGALKADLRYKQAAVVYNNADAFFPVWAKHSFNFGYNLNQVRYDGKGDERLGLYVSKTFYLRRAYDLFASLLKDYPDYSGRDKVLFSLAKCYAKLMDYKPARAVDVWVFPDRPDADSKEEKLEYAHRRVAELFRKVVTDCPESSLADDSERAAQYREKMARLMKLRREKALKQNGE